MSSEQSKCKSEIITFASALDISAIGFARAEAVSDDAIRQYDDWIDKGKHGQMGYLERYYDVRNDPRLLLPMAKTVIVAAFNYHPPMMQQPDVPQFARYAYGKDYHEVVRQRLDTLASFIKENWGGDTRVCVDTAPLRERYWAVKAGIGFIGRNSQLIIPGKGSYFFLGTLLTSLNIEPDIPCTDTCLDCGACINACPTKAIDVSRSIDASRCLSYLTIEYRGEQLPNDISLGNRIYGCDTCQTVCPHNRDAKPTTIQEFHPSSHFLALDKYAIAAMTQEEFNLIFRHSAIKRAKLSGLLRNLRHSNTSD